jgi:deoxyribodipyrimidine photolyase
VPAGEITSKAGTPYRIFTPLSRAWVAHGWERDSARRAWDASMRAMPVDRGRRADQRFDPNGDYIRRHVPELRGVDAPAVHEPWQLPSPPAGYPAPIVDHATERLEALDRYDRR